MNLLRLIPKRFLSYTWQELHGYPYNPLLAILPPKSRHAWLSIGKPGLPVPTGAEVALQAPLGDGTRGNITIWADWYQAYGSPNNAMQIAVLATGDPVPPLFALNPINALAGRTFFVAGAADTINQTAGNIQAAIAQMWVDAGLSYRLLKDGADVLANVVRADLGAGTVALISPTPWRQPELQSLSGAFAAIMDPTDFVENPGTYRPDFLAGCRPAPWLVRGAASVGLGKDHSIIG